MHSIFHKLQCPTNTTEIETSPTIDYALGPFQWTSPVIILPTHLPFQCDGGWIQRFKSCYCGGWHNWKKKEQTFMPTKHRFLGMHATLNMRLLSTQIILALNGLSTYWGQWLACKACEGISYHLRNTAGYTYLQRDENCFIHKGLLRNVFCGPNVWWMCLWINSLSLAATFWYPWQLLHVLFTVC